MRRASRRLSVHRRARRRGKPIGFALSRCVQPPRRLLYRRTADLSIYVDRACRGSGVGQKLYAEIERLGRERGMENLISIITSDNEGSLRFHRKNGFTEIGVMPAGRLQIPENIWT